MARPSKSEYHNYYGEFAADPTVPPPTQGDLYFNTTDNTMRYYDGSSWIILSSGTAGGGFIGLNGGTGNKDYQDYTTYHSIWIWRINDGTSYSSTPRIYSPYTINLNLGTTAPMPGIDPAFVINPSTTNYYWQGQANATVFARPNDLASKKIIHMLWMTGVIEAGSSWGAMELMTGLGIRSSIPQRGFWFEKLGGDANFHAVLRDGLGSVNRIDTGVAPTLGQIFKFNIIIDFNANQAWWYIDEVLVATMDAVTLGWWYPANQTLQPAYVLEKNGKQGAPILRFPIILAHELT